MNDQRSNTGWKFGLGLLAGAAIGYWLNSEQGKKVRQDTTDQISNYSHQATDFTKERVSRIQSNLNNAIDRGEELLTELTDFAKNAISRTAASAESKVEKAESRLEKGMKKAKSKINRKANNLEASAN